MIISFLRVCCFWHSKEKEILRKVKNIKICMGSSCFARGNDENLEFIENYIKENNLEAEIEIIGSRCENICATGPNIIIDGVKYYGVDKNKLRELLKNE